MKRRHITRRDLLFVAAKRMNRLTNDEAKIAWTELTYRLDKLAEKDVPKFDDLYRAIRGATIMARTPLTCETH